MSRRSEVTGAAAAIAAVCVLVWFWSASAPPATQPQVAVAAASRPAPPAAPAASASATAAPRPVAVAASAGPADGVEVCGLGRVPRAAEPASGPFTPEQQAQAARTLRKVLDAHPGTRMSALGAFELMLPGADAEEVQRRRDALARSAAASNDAQLYGLALQACHLGPAPACQLLNERRWAALAPDDGAVWLALAEAARRDGDRAGVSEALYRASIAARFDTRYGLVTQLVEEALPPSIPAWQRIELLVRAIGVQTAAMPGYLVLAEYCRPPLADANRRQVCDRLAHQLVDHGRTLMDLTIGGMLGKRAGWPPERLAALRTEVAGLSAAAADSMDFDALDCGTVGAMRAWLSDSARLGELGAMRLRVQRSGLTTAQWAQRAAARHAATAGSSVEPRSLSR